jgi:nucleotide-binding universal stress UspA family protein
MKNILLLVHDDTGQEARFQAALDVARAVGGHLTCLDVAIIPAIIGADYVGGAGAGMLLADELKSENANRQRLEARLLREDVPWDFVSVAGSLASSLHARAGLADLIVVSRQLDDYPLPDMRGVASDVIVKSGKPILAVPSALERLDLSAAMVAWNGSQSCTAALASAVPMLKLADRVTIVEVDDGPVDAPAEEAALYLSRFGIEARVHRLAGETGTAFALGDYGLNGGFGYIVMGGFGHSRFVEAITGGTSRAMLTASPLPLLMAH